MTDKLHMTPELQIIFDDIIRDSSYSSRDLINIYQSDQNFAMFFKEIMLKNEQMKNNIINLRKQHSDMNESDFFRSVVVNHTKSIIEAIKKEYIGILSPEQIDRLNKFQLEITYDEKFEHDITAHSEKNIISINTAYFGKGKSIEEKIVLAMGTMPHELFHFVIQMLKQKELCDERMVYELANGETVKNLGMVGFMLNEGFVEKISSDFCKRNGLFYSINPSYIQYVNLCNYIMRNNSQITEEFLIKNNYEGIFNNFTQDVLERYKQVERTAYINNFSLKMVDGTYRKISTEEIVNSYNQIKDLSNNAVQAYNYHTHTYRSGHGEYCSDKEIVEKARTNGIMQLGFSEHIPNPSLVLPDEDSRMLISEVDGYISSISGLKSAYPDMTILVGYEAEFDPMREAYLGEMRNKVDYMILGQHFVSKGLGQVEAKGNPNYPIEYANMVVKAIESGLFDIVAHPDIFMEFRETMKDEQARQLFEENSIIASQIICEKARDMGIPIEINYGAISKGQMLSDGLAYPHPTFWKVASEIEGLQVIRGIDAHDLSALEELGKENEEISKIEQLVGDKVIKGTYNPAEARKNNPRLQEALNRGQTNALTYETHLVSQIVRGSLSSVEDGLDPESLAISVATTLNGVMQGCVDKANKKDKSMVDEISTISESNDISLKDKKGKLSRKKMAMEETNRVLANQQRTIETAKGNVVNAMNIGCETKPEFANMITQMTEHGTTLNETNKGKLEEHITDFQQSKTKANEHISSKEQSYQLKKVKTESSTSSQNGFINALTLSLIITFVVGVAVGIGYMLYRISIGG